MEVEDPLLDSEREDSEFEDSEFEDPEFKDAEPLRSLICNHCGKKLKGKQGLHVYP
jgi:hypothetical protein